MVLQVVGACPLLPLLIGPSYVLLLLFLLFALSLSLIAFVSGSCFGA